MTGCESNENIYYTEVSKYYLLDFLILVSEWNECGSEVCLFRV